MGDSPEKHVCQCECSAVLQEAIDLHLDACVKVNDMIRAALVDLARLIGVK